MSAPTDPRTMPVKDIAALLSLCPVGSRLFSTKRILIGSGVEATRQADGLWEVWTTFAGGGKRMEAPATSRALSAQVHGTAWSLRTPQLGGC